MTAGFAGWLSNTRNYNELAEACGYNGAQEKVNAASAFSDACLHGLLHWHNYTPSMHGTVTEWLAPAIEKSERKERTYRDNSRVLAHDRAVLPIIAGSEPSIEDETEQEQRRDEAADQAAAVIATLRPKQQEIVRLFYLEDMSYDDIATKLDVPVGTVKSRLNRARSTMMRST